MFYLDDGTLGGGMEEVHQDFKTVEQMAGELGLSLNRGKSEVICDDSNTRKAMLHAVPGLSVVDQNNASCLVLPLVMLIALASPSETNQSPSRS